MPEFVPKCFQNILPCVLQATVRTGQPSSKYPEKNTPKELPAEAIGAQRSRSLRELNEVLAAGSLAMAFSKTLLGLLTVGAVAVSDLAVSSLDLEHEAKPIAKVVSLLESMSNKLEEDQKAQVKLAYKKRDGHLGKSGAVKRAWHFEKDIYLYATLISHEIKHQTYTHTLVKSFSVITTICIIYLR